MTDRQPTVYDSPRDLFRLLSSFWTDVYAGSDGVAAVSAAYCERAQQTLLDVCGLIASMSRYTVPLFRRERWAAITLRESDKNGAKTNTLRYDTPGLTYTAGLHYDTVVPGDGFSFPLPPTLAGARTLLDRFIDPTVVWSHGQDFTFDLARDAIVLRVDPFADPRVPKRDVYADGVIVDREAVLWSFNADFDWETAYKQFGYVVGLRMRSTREYRDLLNAVYDALVGGGVTLDLSRGLAAILGVPCVIEATETVEQIGNQQTELVIVTDRHAYRFAACATPLVEVGDVVYAGDQLTDAVRVDEFRTGEVPAELQAMAVGRGFIANCYYGDLVFENKSYRLQVSTDQGFTRLDFPLGGFPADVQLFFDELHAKGIAAAEVVDACYTGPVVIYPPATCDEVEVRRKRATLAHLLDRRAQPVGEPTAASLPARINPLEFLLANVYRNNVFLVRVKMALVGRRALGAHQLRLLRRMLPPHTAMVVMVELAPPAETVTPDMVEENIGTFQAIEPQSDTVGAGNIGDQRAGLRRISYNCR